MRKSKTFKRLTRKYCVESEKNIEKLKRERARLLAIPGNTSQDYEITRGTLKSTIAQIEQAIARLEEASGFGTAQQ